MTKSTVTKKYEPLTYALSREDHQVSMMFKRYGFERTSLDKARFVVFPGGADINPFLYGEKRLPATGVCHQSDMADIATLKAMTADQYAIGICRGGQFLNVMSGGKLYQHVTDHAVYGLHPIWKTGSNDMKDMVRVTSTHHQMMICGPRGKVLYAANLAKERHTGNFVEKFEPEERKYLFDDAEVVIYPESNALCFQPHPEYDTEGNDSCTSLFFELIAENFMDEEEEAMMYSKYTTKLQAKAQSYYGRAG